MVALTSGVKRYQMATCLDSRSTKSTSQGFTIAIIMSLFSVKLIDIDGTVTELWNYSLNSSDVLLSDNLFAVDIESELVYLGSEDLLLALDNRPRSLSVTN